MYPLVNFVWLEYFGFICIIYQKSSIESKLHTHTHLQILKATKLIRWVKIDLKLFSIRHVFDKQVNILILPNSLNIYI